MTDLENIIQEYSKKGYNLTNLLEIKSGKEATIYRANMDDKLVALKVYVDPERRMFSRNEEYLEGVFHKQHSVRKAIAKKNNFSKKHLYSSWVKHEFNLLKQVQEIDVLVPKLCDFTSTSILMEYIGNEEAPAPRLIDIKLGKEEAAKILDKIMKDIELLKTSGIVHADLSAYNILIWKGKPYIIDFPQAVNLKQNPNAEILYERDINNIKSFFKRK